MDWLRNALSTSCCTLACICVKLVFLVFSWWMSKLAYLTQNYVWHSDKTERYLLHKPFPCHCATWTPKVKREEKHKICSLSGLYFHRLHTTNRSIVWPDGMWFVLSTPFTWLVKFSDEHDFNACLCWCFDEFLALSNYCAHCHWICNFCVWACFCLCLSFCLFDFVLELIGFVFRFEDLCCDYVQHNVLCNESEFSGVCVIQTVGSPVTRQGLNCFICQHSWKQLLARCIYKCQAIMFLAQISLCIYIFIWNIPPWIKW